MPTWLKRLLSTLPYIKHYVSERDRLRHELNSWQKNHLFVPPGHFYSPIPSMEEIKNDETKIFSTDNRELGGIDLHEQEQFGLLETFVGFYNEIPFSSEKNNDLRYFYENPSYSYSDAIMFHCMIRHTKPKRIIEIGSGYSSCLILDTNECFFNGKIQTLFIEPYPELLFSLIKPSEKKSLPILTERLQDVDLAVFQKLEANDILFVDSTHISKTNSDVNRLLFEVLPSLSEGVYIHFHDIFYPFEYMKEWVYEGRAWNEAYILRAFLQYNNKFKIVLMNTYMEQVNRAFFIENMPLCLKNPGGSIWLRKC